MDWNIQFEILVKLLVAILLSSIVGFERERSGHFAGMRTHILVSLTSCFIVATLITWLSPDSLARVIVGIMTGIGFIGAGAILSQGAEVKGLTTAASIWVVAGLGVVIGVGFLFEAIVVTFLTVLILEMHLFSLKKKTI